LIDNQPQVFEKQRGHNLLGIAAIIFYCVVYPIQAKDILPVGEFSRSSLAGWNTKIFQNETFYRFENQSGINRLCAESDKSASGLTKRVAINLNQTPYLNWSWRVDTVFDRSDEKTKQGDDFPARVYVVIDGGFFRRNQALVYVWAGRALLDSVWASPFAGDSVKQIAVRSGKILVGKWHQEKRNVRTDLEKAFGKRLSRIDAVALMTDTDNAGGHATACYGDIWFSAG